MANVDLGERRRLPRRRFTDEFKAGAVRLVLDKGMQVAQVARDLDLVAEAIRRSANFWDATPVRPSLRRAAATARKPERTSPNTAD